MPDIMVRSRWMGRRVYVGKITRTNYGRQGNGSPFMADSADAEADPYQLEPLAGFVPLATSAADLGRMIYNRRPVEGYEADVEGAYVPHAGDFKQLVRAIRDRMSMED